VSAPTGEEREIYKSQVKTAGKIRVKIRLDRPIASADFIEDFGGAALDTAKWSSWQPSNTSITVAGGKLTLASTANTNGFPVVQSLPGLFPTDLSIGWTLQWTMDFPTITSYGTFFRVCDLEHNAAIAAIKANVLAYEVFIPDWPESAVAQEDLGASHTTSHDYELVYTPPTPIAAGQYELFRDTVSKGTLPSAGRQAWHIVIGNGSVQVGQGGWTSIAVDNVHLHLTAPEVQAWPEWTDREVVGSEWWGRLPGIASFSNATHKRNTVDTVALSLPVAGFVTGIEGDGNGPGYRADLLAGYDWLNREIRIESQQSDGRRNTSWKEVFRGLCDVPAIGYDNGRATLNLTVREKNRRRLQMFHAVRGYSDNGTAIDGLIMNKTWPDIINDLCQTSGLAVADYNVLADALKPRSWNVLGKSALDAINELAEAACIAVYRNAGQTYPGRLEVQEWDYGSDTPEVWFGTDQDIVGIDYAATDMGLAAQIVVTVQHSEFGEFSDVYPQAPVPPFGAVARSNAPIAQSATDINQTRLLPFLKYRQQNRELKSIVLALIGQDWLEHNIEAQAIDRRVLRIGADDYYVVDGWQYNWDARQGFRTSLQLVNQHPEALIRQMVLDQTITVSYVPPPA
jgi:hypothetical protein